MSECKNFGNILSIKIPRPTENLSNVGKVILSTMFIYIYNFYRSLIY